MAHVLLNTVCIALTLTGLCLAATAIVPLSRIATLAPTPWKRRAWRLLAFIIAVCVALQAVATVSKAQKSADWSDLMAAFVHLLGPGFVFAIAWLSRSTARDIARVGELERAALLDPLTELPNRRHFDVRLLEETEKTRRSGLAFTLALLDIDHFKHVNDTFGHRTGDLVLKQVASLLRGALRPTDVACRIGGEEFALVLCGLCASEARAAIERLRITIEDADLMLAPERACRITVSIGVATLTVDDTSGSLIERADAALYAAKHAGRNRISLAA